VDIKMPFGLAIAACFCWFSSHFTSASDDFLCLTFQRDKRKSSDFSGVPVIFTVVIPGLPGRLSTTVRGGRQLETSCLCR
jgi:hypothetical protein